jgi:hypothetical protein
MLNTTLKFVSIVLLSLSAVTFANASGGYTGGFRPPAEANAKNYELGRGIFNGNIAIAKEADEARVAEQTDLLQTYQSKLPENAQKKADLPSLAGRLSDEQLAALQTYLKVRFKIDVQN